MRTSLIILCLFVAATAVLAAKRNGRETGTALHLTDLHLDLRYQPGTNPNCNAVTVCCHNDSSPGPAKAGQFGDYECDAPLVLMQEAFQFASTLNPDFVLWTGDDPAHDDFSQSRESNLFRIEVLSDLFDKYFPNKLVYPSLGNHDTFPVDQLDVPPRNQWLLSTVASYWNKWLDPQAIKTLTYGGYYQMQVSPSLRIISINTLYYDMFNFWLLFYPNGTDFADQWKWLQNSLADAQSKGQNVWIIGHIYPGNYQGTPGFSHGYAQLMKQYQDTITGHFYGHSHQDEFRVAVDKSGNAIGFLYVAPSITPFTEQNPSMRVYHYYKDTNEVYDFDQYVLDLDQANLKGVMKWRLEYSAASAYNMTSLTPSSWLDLVHRFQSNDALFQQFQRYYHAEWPGVTPCTGSCKSQRLCALTSVDPQVKSPFC
jgi:sphingomyelin phosphodiesterase